MNTRAGRKPRTLPSVALSLLTTGLLAACAPMPAAKSDVDVIIAGGLAFDGSDAPGRKVDVAIRGERIVAVGPDLAARFHADRIIDARGKLVAPGFIDAHTHPDTYIQSGDPDKRRADPWLHQGVSTIVIGIDGSGTPDIAAQARTLETGGIGTNVAAYVGFGPVRGRVIGQDDRAPTNEELDRMRALVAKGMCEGALGISTGLFYAPQSFASTDEVVELAREAAVRGGLYDTHQRDESSYSIGLLGSIDETLEIGRRASIPVHIGHIKALGLDVHDQAGAVIERIRQARAGGQRVTADQYPWLASATGLGAALLPRWAQDGGRQAMLQRFDEPATRARIREAMAENLRRRGGADALLFIGADQPWTGHTLQQMATQWQIDPLDAAIRVLQAGGAGAQKIASFNMAQADVELFMQQPWVLTASDGGDGHPRQHATFPEKYAKFVVGKPVIPLQAFIHRSTGLTADTLGLAQRGYLREGHFADIVVLDPDRYAPRADYRNPSLLSEGVEYLFVNGTAVLDDGQARQVLPGRALLRIPPAGTCD
ncbi:MAG: amidohydrolase family protein [Pseudoxanthomonas suwonensis]|nr:amidohydrolase family protein [Pseudoxanthomonas suwonensis]